MPQQAHVTSLEAIEAFRAQLIVYLSQMQPVLDEISGEVLHTRSWMEDDRKRYWQQEMRKCNRKLEDAKQELFTASLSKLGEATSLQQMTVQKAQREMRAVEEKLTILKKWDRDLDNRTSPLVKQMEQLHGFLTVEMERAVAYLDQTIRALEAYRSAASQPAGNPGSPT